MAEKKITKKEMYANLRNILILNNYAEDSDEVKFIDHEIELLARKNSKSATATPAQKDALAISELIKDALAKSDKGMTVGALLKEEPIKAYVRHNGEGVSSQVITAILSKGAVSDTNPNGAFIRTVEKKVAYYSLNYGVEGESEGE